MLRRNFLIAACALFAGCTCTPDPTDLYTYACESSLDCAQGYSCNANVCSKGGPLPVDSGNPNDAGFTDAGIQVDAGTGDAGAPDAGPLDAGDVDAGRVDAGMPLVDSGVADAGQRDAGRPAGDGGLPSEWSLYPIGIDPADATASYDTGTFIVASQSDDIWNNADVFAFVAQPFSGNVSITAHVVSLTPTDDWAKTGVMFRQTLDADSVNVAELMSAVNGRVFQVRADAGEQTTTDFGSAPGPTAAPVWVRLVRNNGQLTSFASYDGGEFIPFGNQGDLFVDPFYVGLAVGSHNPSATNTSVFDNVSIQPLP